VALAGRNIESGAMPGAGNYITIQTPLGQWAGAVWTFMADGINGAIQLKKSNFVAFGFNQPPLAGRQLANLSNQNPFAHQL
jgi:hypothetical protein